nr:uncharacterized protein LOC111771288 [Equus caballus]
MRSSRPGAARPAEAGPARRRPGRGPRGCRAPPPRPRARPEGGRGGRPRREARRRSAGGQRGLRGPAARLPARVSRPALQLRALQAVRSEGQREAGGTGRRHLWARRGRKPWCAVTLPEGAQLQVGFSGLRSPRCSGEASPPSSEGWPREPRSSSRHRSALARRGARASRTSGPGLRGAGRRDLERSRS